MLKNLVLFRKTPLYGFTERRCLVYQHIILPSGGPIIVYLLEGADNGDVAGEGFHGDCRFHFRSPRGLDGDFDGLGSLLHRFVSVISHGARKCTFCSQSFKMRLL